MIKQRIHNFLENLSIGNMSNILSLLDNYDYISFDIFDTLIKRDSPTPSAVFDIVGQKLAIDNFRKKRVEAERIAREKSLKAEISLKEIYDNFSELDDSLKKTAIENEINTEISISTPNMEIVDLFNKIKTQKKIILITDMYLHRTVIEKILNKCSISGFKSLYISNEIMKTKAEGALFRYVIDELGVSPSKILHVGNSFKADYFKARLNGLKAIKISTDQCRTRKKYKDILCKSNQKKLFLNAFINNHTPYKDDEYIRFGYEVFGPLLFGFVTNLFQDMKKESIQQVFFLARDGFIIQKAYRELGLDLEISDFYFEASRRSLRVPSYKRTMSYEDILAQLTVPNKTTLIQIFDSLGLDIEKYSQIIKSLGMDPASRIKRDLLKKNEKVRILYNRISEDVMSNAEKEEQNLIGYLSQLNFVPKTALVDIGWGGSMQKYLSKTLERLGLPTNNIYGFYVGLTNKAKENLGANCYKAKGYAFDCLNGDSKELERPFVGLFETLFLEQLGSVKKYLKCGNKYISIRYPYEYSDKINGVTQEAESVKRIQDGAILFIKDIKRSCIKEYIGYDSNVMFSNLYETGTCPTIRDVTMFGDFDFFNNGCKVKLASPRSIIKYIFSTKELKKDLYDSQWKVGFLKKLLKIPFPYLELFNLLRKASN